MSFGILFFFLAIYLEMQKWHFDWKKKIKNQLLLLDSLNWLGMLYK